MSVVVSKGSKKSIEIRVDALTDLLIAASLEPFSGSIRVDSVNFTCKM